MASYPAKVLSPDGRRWVACQHGFFLPVRVLSRLFRRRFLEKLHHASHLKFFGEYAGLTEANTVSRWLAPLRSCECVVYVCRSRGGAGQPLPLHPPCVSSAGWPPERLQPLLAGLLELVPWLEQWHNELDPAYGERMTSNRRLIQRC